MNGKPHPASDGGFTLLEIITTIIIAAILGALMIQFMGTTLLRSSDPVDLVRDEADGEGLVEKIISDYVTEINGADFENALATIKATGYGSSITMEYLEFDSGGDEVSPPPASGNALKVT